MPRKTSRALGQALRLCAEFEKCTGPFYVVHCVNTGMKFLIDTGAAISLLPVRNVPIGVTVQHSDIVIEGISGETQRAVGKVNLKIQPELSGKVFNVTFHIVPKAVLTCFVQILLIVMSLQTLLRFRLVVYEPKTLM